MGRENGKLLFHEPLNIDDHLLEKAEKLTGIKEKTSLVRLGLEALISKNAALRLGNLGGSEKQLQFPPSTTISP